MLEWNTRFGFSSKLSSSGKNSPPLPSDITTDVDIIRETIRTYMLHKYRSSLAQLYLQVEGLRLCEMVACLYCFLTFGQATRLWKPAFPVSLQAAGAGPGPPNRAREGKDPHQVKTRGSTCSPFSACPRSARTQREAS